MDHRHEQQMKQEKHPIPNGFSDRMDAKLRQVLAVPAPRKPRRIPRLRLAVALSLILTLGAAALTYTGILDFRVRYMRKDYFNVLPEARHMIQPLDGTVALDGWTISLREVLYDGRWLHVLFSVTDHSAQRPFTAQQRQDIENGDTQALYVLMEHADAFPSTETNGTLLINGEPVNIQSTYLTAGEAAGEYLFLTASELALTGSEEPDVFLRPAGHTILSIPLTNRTGQKVAAVSAAFDAGDAADAGTLPLPGPVPLQEGRVVLYDLFASPARVVVAYGIALPREAIQADMVENSPLIPRLINDRTEAAGTILDSRMRQVNLPDGTVELRGRVSYTPTEWGAMSLCFYERGATDEAALLCIPLNGQAGK